MGIVAFLLPVALVLAVVLFSWRSRRTDGHGGSRVEQAQLWAHREESPPPREASGRRPDFIDHELDLGSMRYRAVENYSNDEISAESETSVATEEFEVRRVRYRDWKIRLVARNHSPLSSPDREWQDAPTAFATPWEQAWRAAGRP